MSRLGSPIVLLVGLVDNAKNKNVTVLQIECTRVTAMDHIVYPVDICLRGPQGQRCRGVYQCRVRSTVLGIISRFYALSGGLRSFTGICKVPVHVDLGQCKLIQNARNDGIRVGECFHFSKRRGWGCQQIKRGEKGGLSLVTVEVLYQ